MICWNHRRFSLIRSSFVLALLFSLCGCHRDPHASGEKHYAKAQIHLQHKQSEAAIIELSRAVQLVPEMAKAHHQLASLYLDRGELNNAVRELLLTIRYNSEDHNAYLMLGELLLRSRDFNKAKEFAATFAQKWPEDETANLMLVESMMATGEYANALAVAQQVTDKDPNNARAAFDLARLQLQTKDWQHAEKSLRVTWQLDKNGFAAPLLLSRLLETQGKLAEAELVLKELARSRPEQANPLYVLGGFYIRHKQFDEAEQSFRQIQTHARTPRDRASLAVFYQAMGRMDAAEIEFHRILADQPQDQENWRRLAELEVNLRNRDEARRITADLLKADPKDWETLLLVARLDTDDGKPDQALQELNQARTIQRQSPMLDFLTARCYVQQGKLDDAKKSLTDVLKSAPDFAPARVIMAGLELKSGDTHLAIQDLNRALEQKTNSLSPYLLLSQAYALQGDFRSAEENLDRFLDPRVTTSEPALVFETMAWVKLRQGRFPEAIQFATKSVNVGPPTLDSLRVLGLSYLANKQPQQAVNAVQTLIAKSDGWAEGQQLLGELALQANKLDVAQVAFEKELAINPKSAPATYGIGQVQRARGEYQLARDSFQRYASMEPANAAVRVQLGGLAEMDKDWPKATSEYEAALKLDPNFAIAKNNLAWLYTEHGGSVKVALRLAQEARSAMPKDPHVADTLGWVLIKVGSAESALPYLKESVGAAPANASYHYHLGVAYLDSGQTREAKRELERALRLQASFDGSADARKSLEAMKTASD
jgi:tetratricopeptide (TPR) repeat protein